MTKLIVLLIFTLFISTTITMASGGRYIPTDDVIKHPDMFFSNDRGYLIPGLGRGINPESKKGFNPFTYNPITGSNNGFPDLPTFGGGSYMPGRDGDDVSAPGPSPEGSGGFP
ncbi:putative cell wall protein [Cynara cardunculus var. scolymus]|uniref:putative cell wall protein n=1 Tax=Cynara cardunculus var. scolymus TaxID=59895 RepID=UPI000D62EBD6|nr:putative cell wall protein [Cynara cardunculus var. scolymus]